MIRLLLLIGLVFLIYKGRKLWLNLKHSVEKAVDNMNAAERIDDIMVQDPCCQVYIPRQQAIHMKHKGRDIYFCSEECKDKFFAKNNDT